MGVGTVAIPEMLKRGYDPKPVLGSLAAGGTLGILIPPSIMMVVYAVAADGSITDVIRDIDDYRRDHPADDALLRLRLEVAGHRRHAGHLRHHQPRSSCLHTCR